MALFHVRVKEIYTTTFYRYVTYAFRKVMPGWQFSPVQSHKGAVLCFQKLWSTWAAESLMSPPQGLAVGPCPQLLLTISNICYFCSHPLYYPLFFLLFFLLPAPCTNSLLHGFNKQNLARWLLWAGLINQNILFYLFLCFFVGVVNATIMMQKA